MSLCQVAPSRVGIISGLAQFSKGVQRGMEFVKKAYQWLHETIIRYALKFGVVGVVGLAIDVVVFNVLRTDALGIGGVFTEPIGAKAVSVTIATTATWFGNRYWTFRAQRRRNYLLEFFEFAMIAVVGMGISLLSLYVSHYVLGFTSLLADNISANVVGLILATAFRFLMYRYWVYGNHRSDGLERLRLDAEARERDSHTLNEPPQDDEADTPIVGGVASTAPKSTVGQPHERLAE